jgi:hypothetical protein
MFVVYAFDSHARTSPLMKSNDTIEEFGGKNLLVASRGSPIPLIPILIINASPKVSPKIALVTFEFDHVHLSDDKENQQIEFDDLLDDKDGKKEVVEHFDDKENQLFKVWMVHLCHMLMKYKPLCPNHLGSKLVFLHIDHLKKKVFIKCSVW